MKIAIHQPNFLPHPTFFLKMLLADIFILLDYVQFIHNGYQHRTKLITNGKERWLTVPIKHEFKFKKLNEVQFAATDGWFLRADKTLKQNYKLNIIENICWEDMSNNLVELNKRLIKELMNLMKINRVIYNSSSLHVDSNDPTDRIIKLLLNVSTTNIEYISGSSGMKYLNKEKFKKTHIKIYNVDTLFKGVSVIELSKRFRFENIPNKILEVSYEW